jgi:DNA-binding response OmpR family regulator
MSRSVLVVEDYADLRSALTAALARDDYRCECASSSDEAIALLRDHSYEAILLSPRLPVAEDPLVRYVKSHLDAPRLIIMTEPEADTPRERTYRTLMKPFNREQLLALLE